MIGQPYIDYYWLINHTLTNIIDWPTTMNGQTWHTNVPLVYIVQYLLFMNGKGANINIEFGSCKYW
jgi:hypothetical protein